MIDYASPDTWTQGPVKPSHSIRNGIWGLVLGIVVMAAASFFHLIDEPQVMSFGWVALPIAMGAIGSLLVARDEKLPRQRRITWSLGLLATGFAAVAVALVLIFYVLPLGN